MAFLILKYLSEFDVHFKQMKQETPKHDITSTGPSKKGRKRKKQNIQHKIKKQTPQAKPTKKQDQVNNVNSAIIFLINH